jgi:hypothetical protein
MLKAVALFFHTAQQHVRLWLAMYTLPTCPPPLPADSALDGLCSLLVPFDRFMVKLYSASVVAFVTWAVIRWKSLLLTYLLSQHEDGHSRSGSPTGMATQDLERLVLPLDG